MKVVFVVGPTASGKSALALDWAEKFGGVILNADSVQIYQDLLIGSAAPSPEEKKRVPHFLFQEVAPPMRVTAGDFSRMAKAQLEVLAAGAKVPVVFVVGGTGFYLMALEKGMLPIDKADPQIQSKIEVELTLEGGPAKLHAELAHKDPVVATRISPQDHYRLVRALEILRRTGRRLSDIEEEHRQNAPRFPYPLLKLGVQADRDVLLQRVARRAQQMLESGLVDEVRGLVDRGFADWEPLKSVGYRETLAFLKGDPAIPSEQILSGAIVASSMRLAKKQKTWFQRDAEILWGKPDDPSSASRFQAALGAFLAGPSI